MYGSLFAAPLRHPFAPEILAGLTPYGLFLHGQFTIFQAFKDGIRQLLRDHVGADLGMVVSWIVIAPFIVLAKRDLLFFELLFLVCPCRDGVPEGGSGLCDLFVESKADFSVDPTRRDAVDVLQHEQRVHQSVISVNIRYLQSTGRNLKYRCDLVDQIILWGLLILL